jgi:hypothetical protein
MGLFRKRTNDDLEGFWRKPPFASRDPYVLHEHGIRCVVESDGPGMMRTGWAIWDVSGGLHMHQAFDFLSDGYRAWKPPGSHAEDDRSAFLQDMFGRLRVIRPAITPTADLRQLPRGIVDPASTNYAGRCWCGSELVVLLGDGLDQTPLGEEIFAAFRDTHPAFMPPRSLAMYRSMAMNRGLPDPSQ